MRKQSKVIKKNAAKNEEESKARRKAFALLNETTMSSREVVAESGTIKSIVQRLSRAIKMERTEVIEVIVQVSVPKDRNLIFEKTKKSS